jgi:hypothetical protein
VGFVVGHVVSPVSGVWCQQCLSDAYKRNQTTSLALGWWSVFFPAFNPGVLAANAYAFKRFTRLPAIGETAAQDSEEAVRVLGLSRRVTARANALRSAILWGVIGLTLVIAAAAGLASASEPRQSADGPVAGLLWSIVLGGLACLGWSAWRLRKAYPRRRAQSVAPPVR